MNQKRNLGKRIASWLLCMVMVLSIVNLPGFTNTVYAAGYNAGDIPGTTGAGTKSDPVLVDTFTELKAALQSSDNLYIELTGMSDTRTGLDYYELEESRDFNNEAPAIIIPAGTTKHLTISGKIDYRIVALNDTHMQALIANNGGNLYVNGNGSLNVGFAGYTQNLINAVIYNRSGNVYISGYPWITTDKANITNQSLPLYNEGGYMEIDGGYFVGCVNRAGGGNAVALRCGSWATKTVISGGNFSAVNTAYPESAYAMGVIGSSPVEISGGWFYKGVKTDNGKTLNDYVVSGKKVYKAEEDWEVCDPKVEEVEIKVPPLVVGKDFPVPECVSDNAYVADYAWYYSDGRTIAEGAKIENTEYKLHVIVYTEDGKTFDWNTCTIHFNDSIGELYMYGTTYVNTYALFTPVESIDESVDSISIIDVQIPVAGVKAGDNLKALGTVSEAYEIKDAAWLDAATFDVLAMDDVFEEGREYILGVGVKAKSGYALSNDAIFVFNGGEIGTFFSTSPDGDILYGYTVAMSPVVECKTHDFSVKDVTKATITTNGKIVTKCKDCGEVKSTTTIYYPKTIKLSVTAYTYDGNAKKPSVSVVDANGKTIAASNYTVTYASGRKNVGKYTVKVAFKGNYSGTKSLTFKINPVKTSIKTLTKGTKSFKVTWTKKSTQVTGYQIQYSTSSKFASGNKTVNITSYKTTSKTIKSLKAKKKYYVRVRTYKTVSGTKYYSGWSAKKYVTTK